MDFQNEQGLWEIFLVSERVGKVPQSLSVQKRNRKGLFCCQDGGQREAGTSLYSSSLRKVPGSHLVVLTPFPMAERFL